MSWAEVKKINSDLSTPLNLAALINHIDLVGSNYVGYGDVDGTAALLATYAVYAHEVAKNTLANLVKDSNTVAAGVTDNALAFKRCLFDSEVWLIVSQNSVMTDFCEDKLSASTGVGAWLAFIGDIDNAALVACNDITAIAASEAAMTAVAASGAAINAIFASGTAINAIFASGTAMDAIFASGTAMDAIVVSEAAMDAIVASEATLSVLITSDVALNAIAKSSFACSKFATSLSGITTISWETATLWDTIKATLDSSDLFTKSGLITDSGGTKTNTGNVITLIESTSSINSEGYELSVTPAYDGCYFHTYSRNWSTGKHIMWGGHTSSHGTNQPGYCYVKHYKYTAI